MNKNVPYMVKYASGKKPYNKFIESNTMSPTERKVREMIEEILNPDEEDISVLYGPPHFDQNDG